MNRFQYDDAWSWAMYEKFLGDVLPQWSRQGRSLVAFRGNSAFAQFVQRQAHVDLAMELLDGALGIDWKCVRFPRLPSGEPRYSHWEAFLFEEMSCTIPGQEKQGWGVTSKADMILWAQATLDETAVSCWPLPLKRWRAWVHKNRTKLATTMVENRIDGRPLWTRCLKTPISSVCRDLKIVGFRVDADGLISDLWGMPELRFLPNGTVEVMHVQRRSDFA
jgi:hypothetical protein